MSFILFELSTAGREELGIFDVCSKAVYVARSLYDYFGMNKNYEVVDLYGTLRFKTYQDKPNRDILAEIFDS